jgi:hypothetical protein
MRHLKVVTLFRLESHYQILSNGVVMLIIDRVAPFHGVLRPRVPWYNRMGREPIVHNISGLPLKSSAYYGVP